MYLLSFLPLALLLEDIRKVVHAGKVCLDAPAPALCAAPPVLLYAFAQLLAIGLALGGHSQGCSCWQVCLDAPGRALCALTPALLYAFAQLLAIGLVLGGHWARLFMLASV